MQKQFPLTKGRHIVIRILYTVLISALALGGVGPISAAQAAPTLADSIAVDFKLAVYPEKLPKVCPKGNLNLQVGISKTVHKEIGDKIWDLPRPMPAGPIRIDGSVISGSGTLKEHLQDIDGPPGTSVPFVFTADKPGKVTLKFTADVKNAWIGANEKVIGSGVKVQKEITFIVGCKFSVKTILQFPVEIYDITVLSDNAVMTPDEQGSFSGSSSMFWVYSNFNLDPCTISIGATDSQVNLTGQLDEDGQQFVATQTFQPQTDGGVVTCPGGIGGGTSSFTVNPLTFSVASAGGTVTQTVTAEGVSGLATIVVIPEDDEVVAFNPDGRTALSPSPRWAMPWNIFPWSYSALR